MELFDRLNIGRGMSSNPRWMDMSSKSLRDWRYKLNSGVVSDAAVGFLYNLSINEEQTTVIELAHIAAAAIHG
jgi:hypothetical protein